MHSVNQPPFTKPLVVAIVGPTAVGKTDLSLALAQRFDGEIVSTDASTFYRQLDIATDKPSRAVLDTIPHHLIDIVEPTETVTLGQFKRRCLSAIEAIVSRGRLPLLVGGSGLYLTAIVDGYDIPEVSPQPLLRKQWEAMAETLGRAAVHRELARVDAVSAEKINPNNLKRVIRALEVTTVLGKPMSAAQTRTPPPYTFRLVGLQRSREQLYARIDQRIEQMFGAGLLEEVRTLKAAGYDFGLPAFTAIGYRQLSDHLDGKVSLREAEQLMQRYTRRLVRQQHNWFAGRKDIVWFSAESPTLSAEVAQFVQSSTQVAAPDGNTDN